MPSELLCYDGGLLILQKNELTGDDRNITNIYLAVHDDLCVMMAPEESHIIQVSKEVIVTIMDSILPYLTERGMRDRSFLPVINLRSFPMITCTILTDVNGENIVDEHLADLATYNRAANSEVNREIADFYVITINTNVRNSMIVHHCI